MPPVSQGDINHPHQSFFEEGPVTLPIILLQHLTATIGAHWENQPATWFQLLQELSQEKTRGKKTTGIHFFNFIYGINSAQSAFRMDFKFLQSLKHFT